MWHLCAEKAAFFKFLGFIWTWTLHLKNILDCGWTWPEFYKFWTGSGSQNMIIRSPLVLCSGFNLDSILFFTFSIQN